MRHWVLLNCVYKLCPRFEKPYFMLVHCQLQPKPVYEFGLGPNLAASCRQQCGTHQEDFSCSLWPDMLPWAFNWEYPAIGVSESAEHDQQESIGVMMNASSDLICSTQRRCYRQTRAGLPSRQPVYRIGNGATIDLLNLCSRTPGPS